MKKYLVILAMITATILLVLLLARCSPIPQKLLAGKWQTTGGMISAEFVPDEKRPLQGTFHASFIDNILPDLISGTYTVVPAGKNSTDDQLIITYKVWSLSKTEVYTFAVTEDTLSIKGDGIIGNLFGLSLVLEKQAEQITPAPASTPH